MHVRWWGRFHPPLLDVMTYSNALARALRVLCGELVHRPLQVRRNRSKRELADVGLD
jgi:hypothetical protein